MPIKSMPQRQPPDTTAQMSAGQDPQTSELPPQEANQPDPMLQMSRGWMGAIGITIAALAIALILGVVFYGLNGRGTAQEAAAVPPNSAAAQSTNPAAGGKGGAATPGAPRANNSGVKG